MAFSTLDVNNIGDNVPINVHTSRKRCVWCQYTSHEVPALNQDMRCTIIEIPQDVVGMLMTFTRVNMIILFVIVVKLNLCMNFKLATVWHPDHINHHGRTVDLARQAVDLNRLGSIKVFERNVHVDDIVFRCRLGSIDKAIVHVAEIFDYPS